MTRAEIGDDRTVVDLFAELTRLRALLHRDRTHAELTPMDPVPPAAAIGALSARAYAAADGVRVIVYVFDGQDALQAGMSMLDTRVAESGCTHVLVQNGALLMYGRGGDGSSLTTIAQAFAGDE